MTERARGFRVLGIDPSMSACGFAVLVDQRTVLDTKETTGKGSISAQALAICETCLAMIRFNTPDAIAIESQTAWTGGNAQSVERLANARGAVLTAIGMYHHVEGRSGKDEIPVMEIPLQRIRSLLGYSQIRRPDLNAKQRVALCLQVRGIETTDHDGINDAIAAAFAGHFIATEGALVRSVKPRKR